MRLPYSPLRNASLRAGASVPRVTLRAISTALPLNSAEPQSIPLDKAARAIPSVPSLSFTSYPKPIRHTSVDDEKASLYKLLAICSSNKSVHDHFARADEAWKLYNELSIVHRRSLPLEKLHLIAKTVLPPLGAIKAYVKGPGTRDEKALRAYRRRMERIAVDFEQRVRVLAADILTRRPSQPKSRSKPRPSPSDQRLLNFLMNNMSKLSLIGEKAGCLTILQEFKTRAPPSSLPASAWQRAYNLSLQSINKWLSIHHYRLSAQGELQEAVGALRMLIEEMKERGVEANEGTGLILINAARYVVEARKDDAIVEGFENLSLLVLDGGFGIRKTPLGWVGLRPELPVQVKLAVIELVGRSGEMWDLVGVFEAMYPSSEGRVVRKAEEAGVLVEDEGEVPTLSQMVAKEREEQSHRDWLGRPLDESVPLNFASSSHTPIRRPFDAYLPPIPTPSDIVPTSTHLDIPSLSVAQRLQSAVPYSYIFKTMLHYPWVYRTAPGAEDVALLILRIALREAHVQQALWLNSLTGAGGPSQLPALRVDFRWFQAAWKVGRDTEDGKNDRTRLWRVLNGMIDDAESRLKEELHIIRSAIEQATEKEGKSPLTSDDTAAYLDEIDQTLHELTIVREQILNHAGVVLQKRNRAFLARKVRAKQMEEQRIMEEARWSLESKQQQEAERLSKVVFRSESSGGVAGLA